MKKWSVISTILFLSCHFVIPSHIWAYVGMVTGSKTGTYYQFGMDIAQAAKKEGLDINILESEGSIDNIERMNSRENAAFGIVQSDVLGILQLKEPETAKKLVMVYPFYNEEVHILASKEIRNFSDLNGKTIATGTKGSGNWLTFANLLYRMRVKPAREVTDLKPLDALISVLEGRIDAMIYVAGKPVKLFSKIEQLNKNSKYKPLIDQVHFIPLNHSKILKEYYVASEITPLDYAWISEKVPTIAVKALLVSFDFSKSPSPYYQNRCKQLRQLSSIIKDNLDELKNNGHDKWRAVNLNMEIGKWRWDPCTHPVSPNQNKHELYKSLKEMFEQE